MEDPADGVVEGLGGRESLVTTLVGNDPEAGSEQALEDGVESPEASSNGGRGNVLGSNEVVAEDEGGSDADNVAGDVVETSGSRALEAVGGDGLTDLLDGVVGDLELVAVRVEQGTTLVLERLLVNGAHRGQRGAGGRVARRVGRRDNLGGSRRAGDRVVGDGAVDSAPLCGESSGGCHCVCGESERQVNWGIASNKERRETGQVARVGGLSATRLVERHPRDN